MAPDRAVSALDRHSPTVTVKVGSSDEARTISGLSPVARMESPSRVPRNSASSPAHRSVTAAASTSSYQSPPNPVERSRVKTVSLPNRLSLERQPMAMRLMV